MEVLVRVYRYGQGVGVSPSTSIARILGVSEDSRNGSLAAFCVDCGVGESGGEDELMNEALVNGSSGRDKSGGAGLDSMVWRGAKSWPWSPFRRASAGTERDAR